MKQIRRLKIGFALLMILSGLGVIGYPFLSDALAQRHATAVIENYDSVVEEMDQERIDAAKEAARQYNRQLDSVVERDESGEAEDVGVSYVDFLNLGESMGYITIPEIDVNLPVYEGTNDDILSQGVAHMPQSSYPLGGESTHSVLTGHRGLPNAVLFTDLDKLEPGDVFYLHVLDEVLAYQVDQIRVVLPDETADLTIIPGGDYCTLVTCTPYAINSHRLLVRGRRIPYTGEETQERQIQYQALRTGTVVKRLVEVWPWLAFDGAIVIGGEGLILLLLLRRYKKRMEDD
ncbi:MAG: class C sortase [Oscillospiraceae bacterium]|nr:class C sortase [Oscillospiraceae bacterium]